MPFVRLQEIQVETRFERILESDIYFVNLTVLVKRNMDPTNEIGDHTQCVRDGGPEENRWSKANRQNQERDNTRITRSAVNNRQRGAGKAKPLAGTCTSN